MLKDFSTNALRKELARRDTEAKKAAKPKQVETPDFTRLRACCQDYIDSLDQDGYVDDDISHYIFEHAMMAIFGNDVFEWVNKQIG